jgi:cytochrome c-type biogenesis protein
LRRHSRRIEVAGGILLVGMGVAMMTGGWTALMSRMLAFYAQLGWPPI